EDVQFVGEQLQRPVAASLGGITARQSDQPLFDIPFDLDLVRSRGLRAAPEGDVDPLGDQLLAGAEDGPQAGAQGGNDLVIGTAAAAGVVGQEENPGMVQFA